MLYLANVGASVAFEEVFLEVMFTQGLGFLARGVGKKVFEDLLYQVGVRKGEN